MAPWISPDSTPILVGAAIGAVGSILGGIISQYNQRRLGAKSVRAGIATEVKSHEFPLKIMFPTLYNVKYSGKIPPAQKHGIEIPQDVEYYSEEVEGVDFPSIDPELLDDTVYTENANLLGDLDEAEVEQIVDYYQLIRYISYIIDNPANIEKGTDKLDTIYNATIAAMASREELLSVLGKPIESNSETTDESDLGGELEEHEMAQKPA